MKKRKKLCLIFSIFPLTGCSMSYTMFEVGNIEIGYSELERNAFIASIYYARGDDTNIELPTYYEKAKVTELGGYFGRGVPCCFGINEVFYFFDEGYINAYGFLWREMSLLINGKVEIEEIYFNITLPRYLEKITYADYYCSAAEYLNDGETITKIFKPTVNFTISEENEYFYTLDGRLYNKSDDSLALDFIG